MDRKRGVMLGLAAAALLIAAAPGGGLRFALNLHDRADPNPRQVQVAAEVAGLALSVLVSWTQAR